jgi:hypothetical protein
MKVNEANVDADAADEKDDDRRRRAEGQTGEREDEEGSSVNEEADLGAAAAAGDGGASTAPATSAEYADEVYRSSDFVRVRKGDISTPEYIVATENEEIDFTIYTSCSHGAEISVMRKGFSTSDHRWSTLSSIPPFLLKAAKEDEPIKYHIDAVRGTGRYKIVFKSKDRSIFHSSDFMVIATVKVITEESSSLIV